MFRSLKKLEIFDNYLLLDHGYISKLSPSLIIMNIIRIDTD